MIILGQTRSENINQIITITYEFIQLHLCNKWVIWNVIILGGWWKKAVIAIRSFYYIIIDAATKLIGFRRICPVLSSGWYFWHFYQSGIGPMGITLTPLSVQWLPRNRHKNNNSSSNNKSGQWYGFDNNYISFKNATTKSRLLLCFQLCFEK